MCGVVNMDYMSYFPISLTKSDTLRFFMSENSLFNKLFINSCRSRPFELQIASSIVKLSISNFILLLILSSVMLSHFVIDSVADVNVATQSYF